MCIGDYGNYIFKLPDGSKEQPRQTTLVMVYLPCRRRPEILYTLVVFQRAVLHSQRRTCYHTYPKFNCTKKKTKGKK